MGSIIIQIIFFCFKKTCVEKFNQQNTHYHDNHSNSRLVQTRVRGEVQQHIDRIVQGIPRHPRLRRSIEQEKGHHIGSQ